MPTISISQSEFQKHFPEHASTFANEKVVFISWYEKIESFSIGQIFSETLKPTKQNQSQRLNKRLRGIGGVELHSKNVKKKISLKTTPQYLIQRITDSFLEGDNKSLDTHAKFQALSPAEQEAEINDLLRQLRESQGPGDSLFVIGRPK